MHNFYICLEKRYYMLELDPHIHSIASGHGDCSTITDLAKKAISKGLKGIGITDHAPAYLGAAHSSYFRNLSYAPKERCGIALLYGAELNILDFNGTVDLEDELLECLDYAIISLHPQTMKSGSEEENTFAYVNAMKHPHVKIVGHPEDTKYPVDYEALIIAAKHCNVAIEINNSSLSPEGYRGDVHEDVCKILLLCKKHNCPVVVSSDSHATKHVGNFQYALELIKECDFPQALIMNRTLKEFKSFIEK